MSKQTPKPKVSKTSGNPCLMCFRADNVTVTVVAAVQYNVDEDHPHLSHFKLTDVKVRYLSALFQAYSRFMVSERY